MKKLRQKFIKYTIVVLSMMTPQWSFAQYFQGLYDIDSSSNYGWDIFVQLDGSYFVKGQFEITTSTLRLALVNMQISADGSTVLGKEVLTFDDTNASHGVNLYLGYPGQLLQLSGGGYISPISEYIDYLDSAGSGVSRGWGGLIKYSAAGDTIFIKTYTDTPLYYGGPVSCAIMPDGGYMAGGQQGLYTNSYPPAFLVRTDSLGDTLWTHAYQYDTTQFAQINNIIPLADGRIVVAATSTSLKNPGPNAYYYDAPWYMLLDSLGNIIRDTVYSTDFMGGGFLYADMNGGYTTMGNFDSLFNPAPSQIQNFPAYIAHLDTNFRITWITDFPFDTVNNHREEWLVHQLHDSSYVILGDQWVNTPIGNLGWAAKVNRNGEIVWNHYYQSDTINSSFIRDVAERTDGNLIFVGTSFNDTLPAWHDLEDAWLVSTDSNGCEDATCTPVLYTKTVSPVLPQRVVTVYPNPTNSMLNFQYPLQSYISIKLTDITGRLMEEQTLRNSTSVTFNVVSYVPGIYLYQVITNENVQSGKIEVE